MLSGQPTVRELMTWSMNNELIHLFLCRTKISLCLSFFARLMEYVKNHPLRNFSVRHQLTWSASNWCSPNRAACVQTSNFLSLLPVIWRNKEIGRLPAGKSLASLNLVLYACSKQKLLIIATIVVPHCTAREPSNPGSDLTRVIAFCYSQQFLFISYLV